MDPVTILGTAGAVANIVDVITKTIKTLKEIHDRWKDADLTIVNLISQLTSLRAALNKITEWISSDLVEVPQHHQLVMDLEQSVACCHTLMQSIQSQLSKLQWDDNSSLDLGSRILVVFEDKASRDFQKFVKRQTSALTLLLTACCCKTSSEQKALLEKPMNREVFDQVKDDSSSLVVLYDATSVVSEATQSTGVSSKLSRIFPFDSELMSSPVYQRAVRSLFRRPIHRFKEKRAHQSQQRSLEQTIDLDWKEQRLNSDRIDRTIISESLKLRYDFKIALLGRPSKAKESLIKLLEMMALEDEQSRLLRKLDIFLTSIECLRTLLSNIGYDGQLNEQIELSMETSEDARRARAGIIDTWHDLWDRLYTENGSNLVSFVETLIYPRPVYFIEHLGRILEPEYMPSKDDILNLPEHSGLQQLNVSVGQLSYRFLNPESLGGTWKKWAHQLETVSAIVYVVDLNMDLNFYNQGEDLSSELEESLELFGKIVKSQWFSRKPIILLLYRHEERFALNLQTLSLPQPWPRYSGGDDTHKAAAYLANLFYQTDHQDQGHRNIYHYFASSNDKGVLDFIMGAANDIIIQENLSELKIPGPRNFPPDSA